MNKPLPTTPAFCFIAPISYLDIAGSASDRHLVLAHLVDTHPEYAGFYKTRSECGDYVIMDNSSYELLEPYSPDKLIDLAGKCGADAVVLPDYPFQDPKKTVDAAIKFAPLFKAAKLHTFFVPQSEVGQTEDWIDCYYWGANNDLIDIVGMSILGIPNAIPHIPPAYARVVMTQMLIDRGAFNKKKYHHFLGLNSGPGLEIPPLLKMGAMTSMDSSGPVWSAILGHQYTTDADSLLMTKKPKMVVDFETHRTKDATTLARIQYNIDLTLSLFNNTANEVWYAVE